MNVKNIILTLALTAGTAGLVNAEGWNYAALSSRTPSNSATTVLPKVDTSNQNSKAALLQTVRAPRASSVGTVRNVVSEKGAGVAVAVDLRR